MARCWLNLRKVFINLFIKHNMFNQSMVFYTSSMFHERDDEDSLFILGTTDKFVKLNEIISVH